MLLYAMTKKTRLWRDDGTAGLSRNAAGRAGGSRGKARQGSERDKETTAETSVPSRPFSRHVTQVKMRFDRRRELKEPGHWGKSAQAGDSGCDGRALGIRKGQKE